MPLETTIICVDNSDWMRNGDYIPTRFEAQHDAVNLVTGAKTQQNPENTVGILAMAGRAVELLVSPTDDIGKLLSCLHHVKMLGRADVSAAVQVAQLALKHRRNKNGGQRVVVFVGSPVEADRKTLVKVGKQLKKNGIAVDVVSLGEIDDNKDKLQEFVDATNSNNNSHLLSIPPGLLPSDVLVTSPIIHGGEGDAGAAAGAGFGGGFGGDFGGVDANSDPALAMALRVSYEEERARQEAAAKAAAVEDPNKAVAMETDSTSSSVQQGTPARAAPTLTDTDDEEEQLLKQALAMSMADSTQETTPMDTDQDQAYRMALQMSLEGRQNPPTAYPPPAPTSPSPPASAPTQATPSQPQAQSAASTPEFADPNFVMSLLQGLEGVDPNDPALRETLASLGINPPAEGKKDEEKKNQK